MKLFRDQKGMALPLVLIILLVLSLLGAVLWQYSVNDTLQTSRRLQQMQAHYIARSGAVAMAEHIMGNPAAAATLLQNTSSANRAEGSLGNGYFRVFVRSVHAGTLDRLQIVSEGAVGNVRSQVILEMSQLRLEHEPVFDMAISQVSAELLNLHNATVIGNVASGGEINVRPPRFLGTRFANRIRTYPDASLPTWLATGTVPAPTNNRVYIDHSRRYTTIDSSVNNDLVFRTGEAGSIVQVVVDNLGADRNIFLEGDGRLELFITGSAIIRTGNNRYINTAGNEHNLVIYLMEDASLQLQANVEVNGYIYGPRATVYFQSGQTSIRGSVVANLVLRRPENPQGPNGNFIHVPPPSGLQAINIPVFGFVKSGWSKQ